jgi:hypothetical protein
VKLFWKVETQNVMFSGSLFNCNIPLISWQRKLLCCQCQVLSRIHFGTFVLMNAVIYFEMRIGLNFVELHLACWVLSLWDHQLHLSAFNIEIADRIDKTIQKLGTYAGLSFSLTKI